MPWSVVPLPSADQYGFPQCHVGLGEGFAAELQLNININNHDNV